LPGKSPYRTCGFGQISLVRLAVNQDFPEVFTEASIRLWLEGILALQNVSKSGEVVIGNKGADFVSLKVGGRDHEGWSRAEIEVHCGGWTGSMNGSFSKGELAHFAQEVRRLHRDLLGTARLHPIEPNLTLTLTGDGKGHIAVDGIARNDFATGTQLTFRLTIDQTYLEAIADSLSDVDPV